MLVLAHNIDSNAEETFPNVIHRSGTNVMRHQPTVFEQVVETFPWRHFDRVVRRHDADDDQRGFTSRMHFLSLLAASLGGQQGLRPLIASLQPNSGALRLLGGKAPARSTLSDANRDRPAELFLDLLLTMLNCVNNRLTRRALKAAVRLIDSTHIDLGPRMQRWCNLYQGRAAAKIHVVYDPAAQRPVYFAVSEANINDITAAKNLLPIEPGATYVFDLGYYDYAWWAGLLKAGCTFVTRLKSNTKLRDVTECARTLDDAVLAEREGFLPQRMASNRRNPFDKKGREIVVRIDNGKVLRLFTNDLTSPAAEIAALYKERWQIELFFKWIKQNLKITRFMGTSENAIRSQIAVAFIGYVLVRLVQDAQTQDAKTSVLPAVTILLVIQMHLFVRRPLASLLDPRRKPIPPPPGPLLKMAIQALSK